jgi:hypothetical protein
MKRVLLVAICAALAFGVLVAPAAAVPVSDLTALASYFPADTPIFFALRTDDGFVDELDSVIDTLSEALPPGALPLLNLRDSLDDGMSQFGEDATFDNTIRPWLGDTMAVGFTNVEDMMTGMRSEPSLLVAIAITDREVASNFVVQSYEMNETEVEIEEGRNYTLITPEVPSNAFFAVGDDVLLLSNERDLLPLNSDFRSLGNDDEFNATLALLPDTDYNIVAALNLQDFVSQSYATMQSQAEMMGPSADLLTGLESLYKNYPRQVLGLTILNDTAMTVDLAQSAIDYSALEGSFLGSFEAMLNAPPVDTEFAAVIPADAPFALQGTGFGNSVVSAIDAFAYVAELGYQQQMMMERQYGSMDDVPAMVENFDAKDMRVFIDLAFAGMTGLNLQDDVLPNLNGTFTIFGRVLPSEATLYTYDTALVFEVTDAAAMQAIMDQLVDALTRYEADFTYDDGVLVLPGIVRGFFPSSYQEDLAADPSFDLLIALNDDIFAIGTRPAVEYALNPDGAGLASTEAYAAAGTLALEGSQQVGYLSFDNLSTLVSDVIGTMGAAMRDADDMGAAAVVDVLDAFSSASYSARINDDGSSVVRFSLTVED